MKQDIFKSITPHVLSIKYLPGSKKNLFDTLHVLVLQELQSSSLLRLL